MHAYPMLLDQRFKKSVRLAGLMVVSEVNDVISQLRVRGKVYTVLRTLNAAFCFIADGLLTATCTY